MSLELCAGIGGKILRQHNICREVHVGTIAVTVLSLLSAAPAMGRAFAVSTSESELSKDSRLTFVVSVRETSVFLSDLLAGLQTAAGIRLTCESGVGDRRVNLHASKTRLSQLMSAIAEVTGCRWKRGSPSDGYAYSLILPDETRERESRFIRASELREQRGSAIAEQAILVEVQSAISNRGRSPSFADILAELSPSQLRQAAQVAEEPIGVISTSQSHYRERFLFQRPFERLTPRQKSYLASTVGRPEFSASNGDRYASPVDTGFDLSACDVGIVAAEGGLRLAVLAPDGGFWVSPFDAVTRAGIPGIHSDTDTPPEVEEALLRVRMVDLREMAPSDRRKFRIRFPDTVNRHELSSLLAFLSRKTGFALVCDDYLRSRRQPYGWLLTDRDYYTLEQALEQIARSFAHRFVYKDGVVRASTVSLGLDLRAEPPATLIRRLREVSKRVRPLDLSDYLQLGKISPLQFSTLRVSRLPGISAGLAIWKVERILPVVRFYARLCEQDMRLAESTNGLRLRDMDIANRKAFDALSQRPEISNLDVEVPTLSSGFFVRSETVGIHETVTFIIAPPDHSPAKVFKLTLLP